MAVRSSISILSIFLVYLCLNLQVNLVQADASFLDVRQGLERDRSGKAGDPKEKYFHESIFDPHYDGRFASDPVSTDERLAHLRALMQTYLATMADIGAETWIMYVYQLMA